MPTEQTFEPAVLGFSSTNTIVFVLHLCFLIFSSFAVLKKMRWPGDIKFHAILLFVWTNILISSYLTSAVSLLGNDTVWYSVSLVIQAMICFLLIKNKEKSEFESDSFKTTLCDLFRDQPIFCIATLMLWTTSLVMVFLNPFQVPDTSAVKLPNAFFYMSSGGLVAPRHLWDHERSFATPFNGILIWAHYLRYGDPLRPLLLTNFLFSILSVFAILRLCLLSGINKWGAYVATLFWAGSSMLIFHSQTDNDDILGTLPAIQAVIFLFLSLQKKKAPLLLLALFGISLGIAQGTKSFPTLYAPAIALILVYCFLRHKKTSIEKLKSNWKGLGLATALAAIFTLPYYWTLYKEFKRFLLSPPVVTAFMDPFEPIKALYNFLAYNLQFMFSWLPDLIHYSPSYKRIDMLKIVNEKIFPKFLPRGGENSFFPWAPELTNVHLYDHTVAYGPVGSFFLISTITALVFAFRKNKAIFVLAGCYLSWELVFCSKLLYVSGIHRYWLLPSALLLPVVAWFFNETRKKFSRTTKLSLSILLGINIFLSYKALTQTVVRRNIHTAIEYYNYDIGLGMYKLTKKILDNSSGFNIVNHLYGFPIFHIMKYYRGKPVTHLFSVLPDTLNIFPTLHREAFDSHGTKTSVAIPFTNENWTGAQRLGPKNSPHFADAYLYASPAKLAEDLSKGDLQADSRVLLLNIDPKKGSDDKETPIDTRFYWPITSGETRIGLFKGKLPFEYAVFLIDKNANKQKIVEWNSSSYMEKVIPIKNHTFLQVEVRSLESKQSYTSEKIPLTKE